MVVLIMKKFLNFYTRVKNCKQFMIVSSVTTKIGFSGHSKHISVWYAVTNADLYCYNHKLWSQIVHYSNWLFFLRTSVLH